MSGSPSAATRWLCPEVIQTSAMDCGPASLKAFLAGHGICTHYDALRELCYTDVDGTSIDALERLVTGFGLPSEQVLVPVDHVLRPDAQCLPAIIVTKLPTGGNHFVVIWRRVGRLVQVMDPGRGRRWISAAELEDRLYRHQMPLPAKVWTEWAHTAEFIGPLSDRLLELGVSRDTALRLLDGAMRSPGWRALASLDAVTRMVESFVASRGLPKGQIASSALEKLHAQEATLDSAEGSLVPPQYWSARALLGDEAKVYGSSEPAQEQLLVSGAVLVRLRRQTDEAASMGRVETAVGTAPSGENEPQNSAAPPSEGLPMAKLAAVRAKAPPALRQIWAYMRQDGLLTPGLLVIAAAMASVAGLLQALLFKGLLELGRYLGLVEQRVGAVFVIVLFAAILLAMDLFSSNGQLGLGRRLEARFRMAFLSKMARLGDRYFSSRLSSDLTERIHAVAGLRALPNLGAELVSSFFSLVATTLGVIWLDPACTWYALLAAGVSIVLPLIATPLLSELQLSIATYQGALSRYYMDTLLGLVPLRAHVAEHTIKSEHEGVLGDWAEARVRYQRASVLVNTGISLVGMGLSALILFAHLSHTSEVSAVLLLVFWAQQIPALGQSLASSFMQYPAQRSVALRLLEPLHAPDEHPQVADEPRPAPAAPPSTAGMALDIRGVGLEIGEHRILEDVSLSLPPGCHCAVVGPSGAGKTSLVGLLLGWNRATKGEIRVDGQPLTASGLPRLREQTAWIDPKIQLWNDTLIGNLKYGLPPNTLLDLGTVIHKTGLEGVIQKLPEGLNTALGEGGARLSEGEAQRVRLARAMLRREARLVLMDEPFRGLDRRMRRVRLAEVRAWWKDSTVLCITHDVRETLDFDQVVVIVDGNSVEQGRPAELAARPGSKYAELLAVEDELRAMFEDDRRWRRLFMERGLVCERSFAP